MKRKYSAPTAGPEERSCYRPVLLMNYDTKLQYLKMYQVHLLSGVSVEQQAEKWTMYPFFSPHLSFNEEQFCFLFFLLGLNEIEKKQVSVH